MADSGTASPLPEEPLSIARPDSDSGERPGVPATEKPGEEDGWEDVRETKRRRNCPKALDKVQELARPDRHHQNHHSFTFDTMFNACSPESTPKFGSFNFCGQVGEERERTREREEREDEEGEERVEEEEEEEEEEQEEREQEQEDEDSSNNSVINGIGQPLEGE